MITSYSLTPSQDGHPATLSVQGVHLSDDGGITERWGPSEAWPLSDEQSFAHAKLMFMSEGLNALVISGLAKQTMTSGLKLAAFSFSIAAASGGYHLYQSSAVDAERTAALASAEFQDAVQAAAQEKAEQKYGPVLVRQVRDQFQSGAQTVTILKEDFERAFQPYVQERRPGVERKILDDKHPTDFLGKGTSVFIVGLAAFFAVAGLGGAGQAAYRAIRFNRFANVNERGLRDLASAQAASNPSSKRDDAAGAPAPA